MCIAKLSQKSQGWGGGGGGWGRSNWPPPVLLGRRVMPELERKISSYYLVPSGLYPFCTRADADARTHARTHAHTHTRREGGGEGRERETRAHTTPDTHASWILIFASILPGFTNVSRKCIIIINIAKYFRREKRVCMVVSLSWSQVINRLLWYFRKKTFLWLNQNDKARNRHKDEISGNHQYIDYISLGQTLQ